MEQTISLPDSEAVKIAGDPGECARAASLVYVSDRDPGYKRLKRGSSFIYVSHDGKKIRDPQIIGRIRSIVIPPAWDDVWICRLENGHIQATGYDLKRRKQYRYHHKWNSMRNLTKFSRLLHFGEKLPQLRLQMESDLAGNVLNRNKVIATVLGLMERTYIRVGNQEYEKLYKSYGLTTLKDRHVKIEGSNLRFSFTGKKGIRHDVSLTHRRLARIVKQCRDIPGRELFQYYDDKGEPHVLDSGHVNEYIQEVTGEEFTAKDFRTWAGTLHALQAFKQLGEAFTDSECRKKIIIAFDLVSKKLGNTRTVCKKYYVHPAVVNLYERRELKGYLRALDRIEATAGSTGWTPEEEILLKILRRNAS
jgi:DNA topoisomerase-1